MASSPINSDDPAANPTGANYLTDLATILGNYAKGGGEGRVLQGGLQNQQDANAIGRFNALQGQANANAGYQISAPGAIAKNAVRGDILANGQDASFSGLPSYLHPATTTGGLRPSLLSDTTRHMGQNLTRDAMLAQIEGEKTGYKIPGMPEAPKLTPLPEPGLLDQIASKGALASALAGAGGAPGSGSSGNISKLASDINKWLHRNDPNTWDLKQGDGFGGDHTSTYGGTNPYGSNLPGYDAGAWNDPNQGNTGMPTDPSGGSGVGPGMAEYLAWLAQQQNQQDGTSGGSTTGTDPGDE